MKGPKPAHIGLALVLLTWWIAGCHIGGGGGSGTVSKGTTTSTALSVSPAAVAFGSVSVGTTNTFPATMTALNGSVTVDSVIISDAQVVLTGISFPLTLSANQSVSYGVVYHPTIANSNFSTTITFSTTGVPNTTTQTVTAKATPPPPTVVAVPPSIDFGNVTVGMSSTLQGTVEAQNATVTVQSISASAPYSVGGIALPLDLQPSVTLTYNVTFTPTTVGSQSGTITLVSTASNSPTSIPLSGNGVSASTLSVSPALMDFGSVAVGQTVSQSGLLSAAGGNIVVTSVNPNDPQLTVSGLTFPQTVNNSQSVPFTVTFKPTSAGTLSSSIDFNITTSPFTVTEFVKGFPFTPSPHNVVLTWTASSSPVAGYNVYRGTQSGGPYTKLNSSLVSGTTFTDSSVVSGNTYYYVVTAVDSLGQESALSNEAQAVIPIP